ncbi:MAG: MarR family transcriptional regulator [Xanthomonadaceae bacterium]|nr:MarR family transcriptional regulator [Xanthomonadaceae bacterium]
MLFSETHLRLLGVLALRPDETFHVRELERQTGMNAGTLSRALRRMEAAGLVATRWIGNQLHFAIDPECFILPELQGIVRKTVGLADVLRDALLPLQNQIEAAFVFGSMAAGTQGPRSDVDLMIVGDVSFDDIVMAIQRPQEILGRPVNPAIYRAADFAAKRAAGHPFLTRVLSEPRLMLLGTIDEPRESA